MIASPATIVCFFAGLVCLVAACLAIWWSVVEYRRRLRIQGELRQAERQLETYREWAGDHVYVWAQNLPEGWEITD